MIQAGDQVGQYEIVRRIGSGGMATVYLAMHPRLERQVALKVMHESLQQDAEYLSRFEREARIVAGLEHPHIIPVFDYSEHEGKPYLVMKYVQGRSLKSMLDADTPLNSITAIVNLLEPIADALDYAHSKGILHRDVKPSNIMLDENDIPYLADFGLARIAMAGESTLSQDVILGTPQYISPEQAQGKVNIDGRADIYSLGIVIYQLLVGDVPFSADTPFAVIHDHIYRPIPNPQLVNPDITPEVADVLEQALAKSPENRYRSAKALITDLKSAAESGGLDVLNPEYVSQATSTIALLREEGYEQDLLATPYTPRRIENPIHNTVVDNSSLVTEYRYRHEWVWTLGGFIAVVATFIGIGVVSSEIDGHALASRVTMSSDIYNAQISARQSKLSDLGLNDVENIMASRPDEPNDYIAAAQTLWIEENSADALETVMVGRNYAENTIEYYLLSASIAQQHNDTLAAFRLYIEALAEAEKQNDTTFEVVRNFVGNILFDLAVNVNEDDRENLIGLAEQFSTDTPDMAYITLIIAWHELGDTDQAAALLETLDRRDTRYQAEYKLLQGNQAWQLDDVGKAREAWSEAIDRDYTPPWIANQVQNMLDLSQNESNSQ